MNIGKNVNFECRVEETLRPRNERENVLQWSCGRPMVTNIVTHNSEADNEERMLEVGSQTRVIYIYMYVYICQFGFLVLVCAIIVRFCSCIWAHAYLLLEPWLYNKIWMDSFIMYNVDSLFTNRCQCVV